MTEKDELEEEIIKGLPPTNTQEKEQRETLARYVVVGLVFAALILVFGDAILTSDSRLQRAHGMALPTAISGAALALPVAAVQAWLFRDRIPSRRGLFVALTVVFGAISGAVSGVLLELTAIERAFLVGGTTGLLTGLFGSLAQNQLLRNERHGSKWFWFSTISMSLIFGVGWEISWGLKDVLGLAVAAAFVLMASGIALFAFLRRNPEIEFS